MNQRKSFASVLIISTLLSHAPQRMSLRIYLALCMCGCVCGCGELFLHVNWRKILREISTHYDQHTLACTMTYVFLFVYLCMGVCGCGEVFFASESAQKLCVYGDY